MTDTLHIYTRVSSDKQEDEGTSLQTQKELGITYAEKNNFDYKIWNEGARSSHNDDLSNRPVLMDLLKEIEDQNIKHLYVWNTDRLSRNLKTWGMIRFKLVEEEVTLHTPVGEQILSDPTTNMLLGIMSEISQYDNSLRTERFRLGKLRKVQNGGWKGGPPPFGYEIANGKLTPHPEESRWVKTIYQMYADKNSIRDIRNALQQNGVLTRRGKTNWGDRTIELILRHSYYQGHWTFRDKKEDEPFVAKCPRILDDELIKKVRDEIASRSTNNRVKNAKEKYFYLLKGFLRCKDCGLVFSGRISPKHSVYYCPSKERNFRKSVSKQIKCTNSRYLRIKETDNLIWNAVIDTLTQSNLYKETFKTELLETSENYQKQSDRLKTLRRKKKKIELEVSDLSDTIVRLETDKILKQRSPDEIDKIIKNVEKHQSIVQRDLQEINVSIDGVAQSRKWVNWVNKFSKKFENLSGLTDLERKQFLQEIISEVSVETLDTQIHRLQIRFLTPIVDDDLVWKDKKDKKLGYELVEGKLLKSIDFDVGKMKGVGV